MSDARKRQLPRTSRTRSNCWPMWSRHGREFPAGISLFLHLDGFDVNLVDAKRVDDLEGDESSVVLVHDALHVFVQVECGHLLERRPAVLSFAADSGVIGNLESPFTGKRFSARGGQRRQPRPWS